MNSFILRFGMSGSMIRLRSVSISETTIRSSSALDLASPIDLTRSRNSLESPQPDWDPIASSRPIVFNCSRLNGWDFRSGVGDRGSELRSELWNCSEEMD